MNRSTLPEIAPDLAPDEAEAFESLRLELTDAIRTVADLERAAETESEKRELSARRSELEGEHAAACLRQRKAKLRRAIAEGNRQERRMLQGLILANTGRLIGGTGPKSRARSAPLIARSRARSSRGSSARTRGSRRTARSTGPPGDDAGGDPEPPGLELETGRQTDKSKIDSTGGLS